MRVLLLNILVFLFKAYSKKVLVIGATGRVGREVVTKLKGLGGVDINCLVRNLVSAKKLVELSNTNLIEGNTESIECLLDASKNCDVIIDVHGMKPPRFSKLSDLFTKPDGDKTHPFNVNYLGTKRIISAIKINKVKKLIRITGSLTGKSPFLFPVFLFNLLLSMSPKWHERSEIAIRESGINYTVLRPTEIVNENEACRSNKSLILIQGDSIQRAPSFGSISIKDVADLCVKSAINSSLLTNTTVIISSSKIESENQNWDSVVSMSNLSQDRKSFLNKQPHELALNLYLFGIPLLLLTIYKFIFKILTIVISNNIKFKYV